MAETLEERIIDLKEGITDVKNQAVRSGEYTSRAVHSLRSIVTFLQSRTSVAEAERPTLLALVSRASFMLTEIEAETGKTKKLAETLLEDAKAADKEITRH